MRELDKVPKYNGFREIKLTIPVGTLALQLPRYCSQQFSTKLQVFFIIK